MGELILAALIVLADQLVKSFSTALVLRRGPVVLIPGVMRLSYVRNFGASYSILQGKTLFLLLVTGVVCLALIILLTLGKPKAAAERTALAMVLGGAVGNALDRLADGYVTDMLETLFIEFPVFNVADCFITVGGILFVLYTFLEERRKKTELQDAGNQD